MDTVFIDTSIFESNNFLEGKRIKEVFKLAERNEIRVVLPQLTYDEIINRITKNINEASQQFKKYRNDTRILRNIPSLSTKFEPFDNDQIKQELIDIVDKQFKQSNFIIVDYPTLNIEGVFKSYFEKRFPFSSGSKKSEFPDAFALKSIEVWASENKTKVLAFSKDNDMLNYKSDHLEIIEDFNQYLSNKITEGNKHRKRLEQIENTIKNDSDSLQSEIKEWVQYQLDDDSKYFEYSNYYDVHDMTIHEVNTDIEEYSLTNISEDYISVELKVWINYRVEIVIDDEEYMFKDEDTKEWFFTETKPVMIDEIRYIDVDVIFSIEPDDDIVYEHEIEEINGGRSLNV